MTMSVRLSNEDDTSPGDTTVRNNYVTSCDCGFDHDDDDECPAEDIEYYYCGRCGHYKRMCPRRDQQKPMHGVRQEEPYLHSEDDCSYARNDFV